jgi:D-arabinose 1-dehydrogenase-like Zn-dependent alcohol dehydrogenase
MLTFTSYIDSSKGDVGEQLTKLGGAACIILTAPTEKMIPSLLAGLGPRGKLLVLAAAPPVEINTALMIGKATSITAWPSGHAMDSEDAIAFAQVHGVEAMIEKFPFDKGMEAMEHMTSGKVRFRGVLIFD